MKRIISILLMVVLAMFISCTKNDKTNGSENGELESHKIIAQGWGETEDKALADAKEDALRQFGFKVIEKDGKPELIPAGKILKLKVLSSSSEEIEKAEMWWDVEIEAELTNI